MEKFSAEAKDEGAAEVQARSDKAVDQNRGGEGDRKMVDVV